MGKRVSESSSTRQESSKRSRKSSTALDLLPQTRDAEAPSSSSPEPQELTSSRDALPFAFKRVRSLPDSARVRLPRCECFYMPDFVERRTADEWYDALLDELEWYQPKLKMYGKEILQSRKIAAYATDPTLKLKYSGQEVDMLYEMPPTLRAVQTAVEERLGISFNHCMANLYEHGHIYIGNHRDNPENHVIASLSLGAERSFVLSYAPLNKHPVARDYDDDDRPIVDDREPGASERKLKWDLANGSLLVMQGHTQHYWKHEIPKQPAIKHGRISLTFRQLENKK